MYNQLEIYKIAYDLTINLYRFTGKMERNYRYTLGEKINNNTLELLISIYDANSNKDERYALLYLGRKRIERLRVLIRLAKDMHVLPLNRFVVFNEMIENISRQMTGWQRSVEHQKDRFNPLNLQLNVL
jgi:hypothetical protein